MLTYGSVSTSDYNGLKVVNIELVKSKISNKFDLYIVLISEKISMFCHPCQYIFIFNPCFSEYSLNEQKKTITIEK